MRNLRLHQLYFHHSFHRLYLYKVHQQKVKSRSLHHHNHHSIQKTQLALLANQSGHQNSGKRFCHNHLQYQLKDHVHRHRYQHSKSLHQLLNHQHLHYNHHRYYYKTQKQMDVPKLMNHHNLYCPPNIQLDLNRIALCLQCSHIHRHLNLHKRLKYLWHNFHRLFHYNHHPQYYNTPLLQDIG